MQCKRGTVAWLRRKTKRNHTQYPSSLVEDWSARQVSEIGKGENRIVLDWFTQVTHDWNGVERNGVSESTNLHWTSDWMLREMLRTMLRSMLQYARNKSFTLFEYSHIVHHGRGCLPTTYTKGEGQRSNTEGATRGPTSRLFEGGMVIESGLERHQRSEYELPPNPFSNLSTWSLLVADTY
jgi:hypothetical protein